MMLCPHRTAAECSSAAAPWVNSGTCSAAAASCWLRSCRATDPRSPATPSKKRRKFSLCQQATTLVFPAYELQSRFYFNDMPLPPPPLHSMKRAASLNYLNKSSDESFQVTKVHARSFIAVLHQYHLHRLLYVLFLFFSFFRIAH